MSFQRGIDGPDPVRADATARRNGAQEHRRVAHSTRLGVGTLACPVCDAPVAIGMDRLAPADAMRCPFCAHHAPVREFLSLGEPTRPTRVEVRVIAPARVRISRDTAALRTPAGPSGSRPG
ncbi:hypothetical protein [Capillimicrobium parvum]|uniref:hypothetical protein n=1 Tax=Capillimicrobium parvum TaxID=2884022 RepID=UPI00216B3A6F|nr:hypothetical protein [Capillimicrobium parvum]